ncbi:MAG: ImmA/IrrE family metallo-endopeptidase [Bacilli bacterium]
MKKLNTLDPKDIYEIQEEVKKIKLNFNGDIKKFVREENIILIYLPINQSNENLSFSSLYMYLRKDDMYFMGVNSSDYYDNQLFAIAHELYHHYEKDEVIHLSRISLDEEQHNKRESKANRFAAELLLSEEDLKSEIKKINNYDIDMNNCTKEKIYRLIAKLHCEYKLPYKAIVKRLKEICAINEENYNMLYNINSREKGSKYYNIGISMNKEVFEKLNEKTNEYGIEGSDLEDVIGNYEAGFIDIRELIEDLGKFDKKISDFGYENELEIDEVDLEEFDSLFSKYEDE